MQIKLAAATLAALSLAASAHAREAADPARNKALVEHFVVEVFHDRDVDAADKYLAADYKPNAPGVAPGLEGFKSSLRAWFAKVPISLHEEIVSTVAEGDYVVVYQHVWGVHPKTGKPFSTAGFDLFRVQGGKIVEHWDAESFNDAAPPVGV